jgi:squalene-hopene/tetraprenyl-beta-curcumene cyclase
MRRLFWVLMLGSIALAGARPARAQAASASGGLSKATRAEVLASIAKGLRYLDEHQKPDGSWESDIGISGLAALAYLRNPAAPDTIPPNVDRSLAFITSNVKPDGGIYVRDLSNYYTAVALKAITAAGEPKYAPIVDKAKVYLASLQVDEGEDYTKSHKFYGGIGYGSDLRPDMANLEFALSALKDSALPSEDPLWQKALLFVQRTQNRSESNDQAWAGDDGGFVYYPGFSYGGDGKGTQSYGSMTYAGLLSYAYADVKKSDPRVEAALRWIREHYTLDENPGMGLKTLYYYYMVFAKALNAFGEEVVVDREGRSHNWREELGKKLVSVQYPEGYWVNQDPAWWQDNKVLVTSFTLIALEHVLGDPGREHASK